METRSLSTTSVEDMSDLGPTDANSVSNWIMNRGRDEVDMDLDISAYLKPLARSANNERITTAHETTAEIDETFDEIIEFNYDQEEATKRSLGRTALSPLKWLDRKTAYLSGRVIAALPGTKSWEERQADQEHRNEIYATAAGDSWYQRVRKFIGRNRYNIQDRVAPYALGALAMSRVMPHALDLGIDVAHGISDKASDIAEQLSGPRTLTIGQDLAANAIDYTPVEHDINDIYDSKAIVMGGRGDTTSVMFYNSMEQQGIADPNADLVDSPAGIAPVDPVTMEVSSEIAAAGGVEAYDPNSPMLQTIYGYSEGSAGAIKAYNDIVAANGGVKPDNLQLVLVGSPYAQGGFFQSDYVGVAGPVLNSMGIPTDLEVPPGATVVYSPNDFWANGDNQSFLGMMSQLADLGGAGHNPDMTGEFYEFTDENGVRHLVKKGTEHALVELAETHGIPMPPGASEILQKVAPINQGFSDEVPKTDVYGAADLTADMINQQTGTNLGSALMDNIPAPMKDLAQSGLTAVNEIPGTAAGIANGTISPQEGVPQIMNQVQDVVEDLGPVLQDPIGAGQNYVNNVVQDAIPPEAQPFVAPLVDQGMGFVNQFLGGFNQPR